MTTVDDPNQDVVILEEPVKTLLPSLEKAEEANDSKNARLWQKGRSEALKPVTVT